MRYAVSVTSVRYAVSATFLILAVSWAAKTQACSTCIVGDPTLTTSGYEQPYANRLRLSLLANQYRKKLLHADANTEILEHRLRLGVAWAPIDRFFIDIGLPLIQQHIKHRNLAIEDRFGIGDLSLNGRYFLWRDRNFAPHHLLSTTLGFEFPTGPKKRSPEQSVADELFLGTGAWSATVGLAYSAFLRPLSIHLLTSISGFTNGYDDIHLGPSWRSTFLIQYQPFDFLALRTSARARVEGKAKQRNDVITESGGSIVFIEPGVLASLGAITNLGFSVAFPVFTHTPGRREGIALRLECVIDIQ